MVTSLSSLQSEFGFFFFFFITSSFSYSISSSSSSFHNPSSSSRVSYSNYCHSVVPKSTPNTFISRTWDFPRLRTGYFTGGDNLFTQNLNYSNNSPKSFSFRTKTVYTTDVDDVLMVEGNLVFRVGSVNVIPTVFSNFTYVQSKPARFKTSRHRFPLRLSNRLRFTMNGFWSESSGKLCMVGTGIGYSKQGNNILDLSAVFKINYPRNSTIFTSLATGSLVSVDRANNVNYFDPITVLTFSQRNYEYTLILKNNETEFLKGVEVQKDLTLRLDRGRRCSGIGSSGGFELEYGNACDATKTCNPLGKSAGVLPEFMFFNEVQCSDDERLRLMIAFSNSSYSVYGQPLDLSSLLVGEGVWDGDNNLLQIVACRVLNYTTSLVNASIGDCSVRMTIWFPAIMSIKSRSHVVGQLWSNRTMNDSGYFDKIVFQSPRNKSPLVPDLKYEYTMTDKLVKSCGKETLTKTGKRYPSGYSYDMKFDMRVRNKRGISAWGYSVPLSVGDQLYEQLVGIPRGVDAHVAKSPEASVPISGNRSSLLNVSYSIRLTPDYNVHRSIHSTSISLNLDTPVDISAEGIYNTETGNLCMFGCRYLKSSHNHSMDCEISINVQFLPLDSKSKEYVKGTIKSTRETSDPLYFESLQLLAISLSRTQTKDFVWRLDLEITMVLISNTLICVFVGLQIFYVKKHPDVLPAVSFVMLSILTLGQMIPLVLNFEALFLTDRNRQNVMMGSGGWLEVNEVLVRVVTMISFLLHFRLLQLTWSSKLGDGNQKGLVVAEKKALFLLLPIYLVGGFIAWVIHWRNNSQEAPLQHRNFAGYPDHSLWGDLKSYAGLLLDGFLLPQILFNVFGNSKDKALYPAFYVGVTSVHLLPHAYDLYRAHRYVHSFDTRYIYANPGGEFFSTAWDVIIPCGGLLFAILIYLQQRSGGRCILPKRFRQSSAYEKVPVASGE
ncbi:hypothetical protein AQUCO_08400012v1 [Aquilegia coerulea]|uniref:RING-type E3 ubiquitin transferase n=1 Tax=Aquilegia coerulea TaxID=218851 RepID=A0A2G5C6N4_AQUCA|nr:hypothetical protein AQUCO_08400012v1 [Aquilegia coerulea]